MANQLLAALPAKVRERILAQCETVDLEFGVALCEPQVAFQDVYFPLTAFISLVAAIGRFPPLEMGLIGDEGMLGATLVLAVPEAPLRGIVQGPGKALRLPAAQLARELQRSPSLQRILKRYLYVLSLQLSQTAGCTRFHEIQARLARWLLMTHDRAHADHFHLTHVFLANMLGVRRAAVTIAAGALQKMKAIRYRRGEIRILDRARLERASCECYAEIVGDYAQVLSRFA